MQFRLLWINESAKHKSKVDTAFFNITFYNDSDSDFQCLNPPVHCMVTGGLNLISQLLTHRLTKATGTLKQNVFVYLFIYSEGA